MLAEHKSVDVTVKEWLGDPSPRGKRGLWVIEGSRTDNFLNVKFKMNDYPILGLEYHRARCRDIEGGIIPGGWYHVDLHYPFVPVDAFDARVRCFQVTNVLHAEWSVLDWIESVLRITFEPGQEVFGELARR